MDLWTTLYHIVVALLILCVTMVIYDWLCDLAWRKKYNLKGPFPLPLLKNLPDLLLNPDMFKFEKEYAKQHKTRTSTLGVIGCINVYDVELLKKLFIKDHLLFQNRYSMVEFDPYPLMYELIQLKDEKWKRVRSIVTPSFSSGKIKMMVGEINYCGRLLIKGLEEKARAGEVIDARRHFGCYTMDVIAATAFGLHTDAYNRPEDKFVDLASKVFGQSTFGPSVLLSIFFPRVMKFLLDLFKMSAFYPLDSVHFFTEVLKELIENRKKEGDTQRVDLLQLMLNAELEDESADSKTVKRLNIDELLGQGFLVFIAGYETTAALLSYMAYVLATHPEVQDKLMQEIDEQIHDVDIDIKYETVMEMKYLEQVINETLRHYPPVDRMNRTTSKDQDVQIDGHWFPGNTLIGFSIYLMHHLPEYWPEPDKFRPERFSPEEKAKRDPFVFMPFGQGPRNCIGMRLALLEAKIAMIHTLKKVKFVACEETQVPLELTHGETFLRPKKPIKVGIQLR